MTRSVAHFFVLLPCTLASVGCLDLNATCEPLPDVVFVHGTEGNDAEGNGECATPFKSIGKGIEFASTSGKKIVRVAGSDSPIVYSAATTNETFPIELKTPGLTLEGDGRDKVVISNDQACDPMAVPPVPCKTTLVLSGPDVTLRSLHIRGAKTYGMWITSSSFTIDDIESTNHGIEGIRFEPSADFKGQMKNSLAHSNTDDGVKVFFPGSGMLTLTNCIMNDNGDNGLWLNGAGGTVDSSQSEYRNNGNQGLALTSAATFLSNTDSFENNGGSGVSVTAAATVDLDQAMVRANTMTGVFLGNVAAFKIRNSEIVSNVVYGLDIANNNVDLGTITSPGKNVFQRSTMDPAHNVRAGICFFGTGTINAYGNTWGACPTTTNADMSCGSGVDYGAPNMGTIAGLEDCASMARAPSDEL